MLLLFLTVSRSVVAPCRAGLGPPRAATGTRVPAGPQDVRSLQAATPLGVDRPDAASANTTGPLVVAGAALAARHGAIAPARTARRARAGLQARTVRPAVAPRGSSPRGTLRRPDDAREDHSFRRRPVPRSASFPGRVFNAITPGRLMFLEPSGSAGLSVSGSAPRWPLGRFAPRPLVGNGRSAMPSIGAGSGRLNRPARPPQVAARHQRARQPGVRP
jgi:hypothetical protein